MKVLIACEESQRVCTEFRRLGHEAYSCDVQEPSGGHPEWHILGDVLEVLNPSADRYFRYAFSAPNQKGISFETMDGQYHQFAGGWDMIIAHPPCTYLTNAGNKYFKPEYGGKALHRMEEREKAAEFFMKLINADCGRIAVENPCGWMNGHYRPADQTIHPYYFAESTDGECYHVKRTCLWLKNLPKLQRTSNLPKPEPKYRKPSGKGVYFTEGMAGRRKDRQKNRSKTFPGIARAMAEQWGGKV